MSMTPEKTNADDDINIVHDDTNKNASKRSGYSLPLPPGAVPVGTLPRPPLQNQSAQRFYGLCTQSLKIQFPVFTLILPLIFNYNITIDLKRINFL